MECYIHCASVFRASEEQGWAPWFASSCPRAQWRVTGPQQVRTGGHLGPERSHRPQFHPRRLTMMYFIHWNFTEDVILEKEGLCYQNLQTNKCPNHEYVRKIIDRV